MLPSLIEVTNQLAHTTIHRQTFIGADQILGLSCVMVPLHSRDITIIHLYDKKADVKMLCDGKCR